MNREELKRVLDLHQKWLQGVEDGKRADLSEAYLRRADLRGANLRGANLNGADLRGANLNGADLRGANLNGADLECANLNGADLNGADLEGANLRGADLSGADLSGANLDYSCLPLWCYSLRAQFDDRQIIQLLYHVLSAAKYSENVSNGLKERLLIESNLEIANRFHRVEECGEL